MLTYSESIEGYLLYAESRQLSQNTIIEYTNTFSKFAFHIGLNNPPPLNNKSIKHWIAKNSQIRRIEATRLYQLWMIALDNNLIADPPLISIQSQDVQRFLSHFKHLKKKTILNYHTGLSSLWTWAISEQITDIHIPHSITPPKPNKTIIRPYTQSEVKSMLEACKRNSYYARPHQSLTANKRSTAIRDEAIILTLLDTGLRANELCSLTISNINLKEKRLLIDNGKGNKQRYVYLSARTARIIWRYLNQRPDKRNAKAPLFSTKNYTHLTKSGLLQFIKRAGKRAGVQNPTVHRFRHTFAIESLRNGMNAFILQQLLGHSSIDMVKRYLDIANSDLAASHHRASAVENWKL